MTLTVQTFKVFFFNSTGISIIKDINKMGSTIIVVEDNGKHSIGQHSKKDDDRQDPSLWRRRLHCLTATNKTCHSKWLKIHLWPEDFADRSFSSIFLQQPPVSPPPPPCCFQWLPRPPYPQPCSKPGIYFVHDHSKCTNHNIKCSLQPPEEPPWLQSQPRHA